MAALFAVLQQVALPSSIRSSTCIPLNAAENFLLQCGIVHAASACSLHAYESKRGFRCCCCFKLECVGFCQSSSKCATINFQRAISEGGTRLDTPSELTGRPSSNASAENKRKGWNAAADARCLGMLNEACGQSCGAVEAEPSAAPLSHTLFIE